MDLERIKQQFRIRSGRAKSQKKKKTRAPTAAQTQEDQNQNRSESNTKTPNGVSSQAEPEPTQAEPEQRAESRESEQVPEQAPDEEPDSQEEHKPPTQEQPQPQEESNEEQTQPDFELNDEPDLGPDLTDTPKDVQDEEKQSVLEEGDSGQSKSEATETMPEPQENPSSETEDFDLAPPKPRAKAPSLENIAELLFSAEHLDSLLHYPPQLTRFSTFLKKYVPQHHPLLAQYLETQKAIKAVAYANAIAQGLKPKDTEDGTTTKTIEQAARLDADFEAMSNASFHALVGDALPKYISYSLVKTGSELLTNEITGRSSTISQDLVNGLSEVFCLTDPNQQDNPIIYASEEFYRLTRYGPEDTLNNNCRFLQGRKTNPDSPKRLKAAIQKGEEISETLLNYRRDGRPFINLLMIAPLHDKNGKLKYFLGAQIDCTSLVERGHGMEGFHRFLSRRSEKQRLGADEEQEDLDDDQKRKKRALARLRDLSETFDLEESAVVQAHSRSNSVDRDEGDNNSIGSLERHPRRKFVGSDESDYDDDEEKEQTSNKDAFELGQSGDGRLSGKLPGVYDSFLLFRPAPSCRIVFVSPKLRRLGTVLQTPFLSHVAAPNATLTGLAESLRAGVPVSAKIHFTPERGPNREGTILRNGVKHEDAKNGRAIWISCTPLVGADDRIGVWMCIVVEKTKVGAFRRRREEQSREEADKPIKSIEQSQAGSQTTTPKVQKSTKFDLPDAQQTERPIKPVRVDSNTETVRSKDEDLETPKPPDDNRKTIRPQQSVYFDANQHHELPDEEVGMPERTEEIPEKQPASSDPQSPSPGPTPERDSRAVVTPVEEYEEPISTEKDHSVSSAVDDNTEDEYITTRSPQMLPENRGDRVVIEEDRDVPEDEDTNHNSDEGGAESPEEKHSNDASKRSSPVWSPISVPSSAQLPSENGNSGVDAEVEGLSRGRREYSEERSLATEEGKQGENEPKTEHEKHDRANGSADTIRDISRGRNSEIESEHHRHDQEKEVQDPALIASPDRNLDDSTDHESQNHEERIKASSRDSSGDPSQAQHSEAGIKHDIHDDEEQSDDPSPHTSENRDADLHVSNKDNVIAVDNQTKSHGKLHSLTPSPSLSAAKQATEHDPEHELELDEDSLHLDDFGLEIGEDGYSKDIETWVVGGRPASSHNATGIPMDYLRAGGRPWPRVPRFDDGSEEDGITNPDSCLRTPYSVD